MKVKNTGIGTLGFKDDDGKIVYVNAGESVECNYKRSMDSRLVVEGTEELPKKKKKGE